MILVGLKEFSNPFVSNAPFYVFRGYRKGTLETNGRMMYDKTKL